MSDYHGDPPVIFLMEEVERMLNQLVRADETFTSYPVREELLAKAARTQKEAIIKYRNGDSKCNLNGNLRVTKYLSSVIQSLRHSVLAAVSKYRKVLLSSVRK